MINYKKEFVKEDFKLIIRERNDEFIMIKQHDHAQLSHIFYNHLRNEFLPNNKFKDSIGLAIKLHDCGWIPFDETPFWNDISNSPYTFTEFPTIPKTVLYKHGIDQVENKDPYAALLCSEHYIKFLERSNDEFAKEFVHNEKKRQQNLQKKLNLDNGQWLHDYDILQFFDNLSLFVCLNEPGTTQENIHYFFTNGIKLPGNFNLKDSLSPTWTSPDEIMLNHSLFTDNITFVLQQTTVSKSSISDSGLLNTYAQSNIEEIPLNISQT